MNTLIAKENVYIESKYLNNDLKKHVEDAITKKMIGYCDQVYGYITKIDDILIIDNYISTASTGTFFVVQFSIESLKPSVGNEYTGTVCMVFDHGIFVEVENKMKVLIPCDKMLDFKFCGDKFKNKTDSIYTGDVIETIITSIKYEKHNFNCIGSLKIL